MSERRLDSISRSDFEHAVELLREQNLPGYHLSQRSVDARLGDVALSLARKRSSEAPPDNTPATDEQQASGNELQPRALPAQCDRQRGRDAVVVRGEGADRLGHETPVVS